MEALDTLPARRIQFAANISFHILFPTITIALGWVLLFFKLRFNRTGDDGLDGCLPVLGEGLRPDLRAWASCRGSPCRSSSAPTGRASWKRWATSPGRLLAYEVLTAFFLEAVFLGIMLFGFRKVPGWVHTLATFLVAFGTTMSAFWIIVLNSWMHTPAGFEMRRRCGLCHRLDGDHLQPVDALPADPHAAGQRS